MAGEGRVIYTQRHTPVGAMWPGPRYGYGYGDAEFGLGLGGGPPAKLEYASNARLAPSQPAATVPREQAESASRKQISVWRASLKSCTGIRVAPCRHRNGLRIRGDERAARGRVFLMRNFFSRFKSDLQRRNKTSAAEGVAAVRWRMVAGMAWMMARCNR